MSRESVSWKSTPSRYGSVAIALHWTTALAILLLLIAGFVSANAADPQAQLAVLRIHVGLGILVLALTLARIVWWLAVDRRPEAVAGVPRWQDFAARTVHLLLYLAILVLAASGIGTIVLSGAGAALAGGSALPDFGLYPPRFVHGALVRLLLALLALHIAAALYHQFIRRDRLLARMGLGGWGLGG